MVIIDFYVFPNKCCINESFMELNQESLIQCAQPTNGGVAREPSEIHKQEKTTRTPRQENMADSTSVKI